jgi:biopolymer transport protein ExbD
MKNWIILFVAVCFMGCGQVHVDDAAGAGRLTCLVVGYDSIFYYTGDSKQMKDIHLPPLNLQLPRDVPDSSIEKANPPKASQLSILISGDNIYGYMGGDIRKGRKYTSEELTDLLKREKTDKDFVAAIKPGKSCSYKTIVDVLDLMTITGVKNYTLIDITKKEEVYLHQVYQ